jgi:hypothetical protein
MPAVAAGAKKGIVELAIDDLMKSYSDPREPSFNYSGCISQVTQ